VQPAEQLGVHPADAGGRFPQALAIGILAHGAQASREPPPDPPKVTPSATVASDGSNSSARLPVIISDSPLPSIKPSGKERDFTKRES